MTKTKNVNKRTTRLAREGSKNIQGLLPRVCLGRTCVGVCKTSMVSGTNELQLFSFKDERQVRGDTGASAAVTSEVKQEKHDEITVQKAHQIIGEFDINVISVRIAERFYESEQLDDLKLDTEMKEVNLERVIECFEILSRNNELADILNRFKTCSRFRKRLVCADSYHTKYTVPIYQYIDFLRFPGDVRTRAAARLSRFCYYDDEDLKKDQFITLPCTSFFANHESQVILSTTPTPSGNASPSVDAASTAPYDEPLYPVPNYGDIRKAKDLSGGSQCPNNESIHNKLRNPMLHSVFPSTEISINSRANTPEPEPVAIAPPFRVRNLSVVRPQRNIVSLLESQTSVTNELSSGISTSLSPMYIQKDEKLERESMQSLHSPLSFIPQNHSKSASALPTHESILSSYPERIFRGKSENECKITDTRNDEELSPRPPDTKKSENSIAKYKSALAALKQKGDYNQLEFGYPMEIKEAARARFGNSKEELLQNSKYPIEVSEWNLLVKKAVFLSKTAVVRFKEFSTKEIVSLKLYTDFDDLQRAFRQSFREKNDEKRAELQREYYHWYDDMKRAVRKSKDIIRENVFHGVNVKIPPSTFCGTYYGTYYLLEFFRKQTAWKIVLMSLTGPVSTTLNVHQAAQFAGNSGQLIELYPSFDKKGLDISCVSDFPEEGEVLYVDCQFQIAYVYHSKSTGYRDFKALINETKLNNAHSNNDTASYLRALQTISANSRGTTVSDIFLYGARSVDPLYRNSHSVISLNDAGDATASNMGFHSLSSDEKICVLHLLYLQHRPKEWDELIAGADSSNFRVAALAQCREMFVALATNVKAVRMEKLSSLLENFLCTPPKRYTFPFNESICKNESIGKLDTLESMEDLNDDDQKDEEKRDDSLSSNGLQLDVICLLFPNAEQISINAKHWDFSLRNFIDFLMIFNSDYHDVALQDIYIRFVNENGQIINDQSRARQQRKKYPEFKDNLRELRRLGWMFQTPSHLHRVGVEFNLKRFSSIYCE